MLFRKYRFPLLILLVLAACRSLSQPVQSSPPISSSVNPQTTATFLPTSSPIVIPSATLSKELTVDIPQCKLSSLVVPTLPAVIPGYTELDPSTNLHMTGTYQEIDLATYRLKVTGMVDKPLSLSIDELRCLPKVETSAPLVCPGYFQDLATWAGTPIRYVLEMAGIQSEATEVYFISADGYMNFVSVTEALTEDNFLAYEWNNQPLPIYHGFPIRVVFPDLQGNQWVKWLVEISVR